MKFVTKPLMRLVLTGMVILLCLYATAPAQATLLVDSSFEVNPIGTLLGGGTDFTATGTWGIDLASIRGTENGIAPLDGNQMLRFDEAPPSGGSDTYQLIDVSGFGAAIAAQTATLNLSGFFNATASHDFQMGFLAFNESTLPFNITVRDNQLFLPLFTSDADVSTWEELTLSWLIPQGTNFIAAGLNSVVDITTSSYVDQVSLNISGVTAPVPEPGTMLLFGTGLVGLMVSRRWVGRRPG